MALTVADAGVVGAAVALPVIAAAASTGTPTVTVSLAGVAGFAVWLTRAVRANDKRLDDVRQATAEECAKAHTEIRGIRKRLHKDVRAYSALRARVAWLEGRLGVPHGDGVRGTGGAGSGAAQEIEGDLDVAEDDDNDADS